MSGVDPESLSKDKLKAELRRSGVSFNQYENKPYYVNLYRAKLKERESSRSEFSDDEEPSRSPRGSKKPKKKDPQSRFMSQVKDMPDATLRAMLMQHGENPGPIMSSTRSVYERKLASLMEKSLIPGRHSPQVEQEPVQSEQQADEDDVSFVAQAEDELSDDDLPPVRTQERKQVNVVSSYNLRRRPGGSKAADVVEVPPPRSSPPRGKSPRSSSQDNVNVFEIVWKLVVLLLVVGVAFLVYDHVTTPPGTKSIVVRSYEYLYPPNLMKILKPEACASKRKEGDSGKAPSNPDPPRPEEGDSKEKPQKESKPVKKEPEAQPSTKPPPPKEQAGAKKVDASPDLSSDSGQKKSKAPPGEGEKKPSETPTKKNKKPSTPPKKESDPVKPPESSKKK